MRPQREAAERHVQREPRKPSEHSLHRGRSAKLRKDPVARGARRHNPSQLQ